MTPETTLWRSVIAQAILDATNRANSAAERLARVNARKWLTENTPGFRAVCEAADVPAFRVLNNARRLEAAGWPQERRL